MRRLLVTELLLPTYLVGQVSTVERWLGRLGDEAIEAYPPLAVLAGWVAALSGDAVGAQRWAAFLETASFEGAPADGTASFASARAMLRSLMCPSGPEQSVADADLALAQEPPWSAWRGQALGMAGEAHLLAGDQATASRLFEELVASPDSETNTDAYVIALAELAVLAIDRERWDEAAEHIRLASASIAEHRMDDYSTSVIALAAAARLALHQGDVDRASQQLARAMRARPVCTYALPGVAVRARLQLALAHRSLGDHSTARHLLREIDDIVLHRPLLGALIDEIEDLRGLLDSTAEAAPAGGPPLSPAELRLLPYLQTHLTIREIAERLYVSRNTVSSQVSSIYRKLAVTSRSEAVQQASAVGLLGA